MSIQFDSLFFSVDASWLPAGSDETPIDDISQTATTTPTIAPSEPGRSIVPVDRQASLRYVWSRINSMEPVTAYALANAMGEPLALILPIVEELERAGYCKRWVDETAWGQGRTFMGTVGSRGIPEPVCLVDSEEMVPAVDHRTVLAFIRRVGFNTFHKLARQMRLIGLPVGMDVLDSLAAAGHIQLNRSKSRCLYVRSIGEAREPRE